MGPCGQPGRKIIDERIPKLVAQKPRTLENPPLSWYEANQDLQCPLMECNVFLGKSIEHETEIGWLK